MSFQPPQNPRIFVFINCVQTIVERFIRSFQEECIAKTRPGDVQQAQQAADDYSPFYNLERPNQAITCSNRPPSLALGRPPYLPRLPQQVDPDAWLKTYHGRCFKRQVRSNGSVRVDKNSYYIGTKYRGRRVLLRLDAEGKRFDVLVGGRKIKQITIKGLYNGVMDLPDYLELIQLEARSEERRLKQRRRLA